jgi:hypothetical protein
LFKLTEAVEEPPTVTLDGTRLVVANAELGWFVGVVDGRVTTVGIGVLVGFGTFVLVGGGTLVAVGAAGLLEGLPGNVSALISWMFEKPSPSESKFSIDPKAAVFLPLDL